MDVASPEIKHDMDADDVEGLADEVLPGGKDTVSICLITGFESFNVSLYNQVTSACNWSHLPCKLCSHDYCQHLPHNRL